MAARRGPHFTGQTDFTEGQKSLGQRLAAQTALYGQQHRQVGRRFADAHAAHRIHKHILVHASHPGVAVQHRKQHGQPIPVQAYRQTARRRPAAIDQRLYFYQQRARAFERHHDATAGHGFGVLAQKYGARVADAFEAFFGHGEHADFINRTETVFDGPHQAETGMRVAFKVQHRVNHVLKHTRPCQCAFFGDMADQHNGGAAAFGQTRQMRGAFPHLRHRPGRAGELVRIHSLYRINHRDMRRLRLQGADDFFQLGFGQHVHTAVVQTQSARS